MAQKTSGNVDACPVTKETWEARAEAKKGDCGGQSVYHCLADKEGRKWERCVEKTRIKQGICPIFRSDGFIDWKPCNISASTCPNSSFLSNEVYKHVYCFGNNSFHIPKNEKHKKAEGVNAGLVIGIVFLVVVIVGIIAAVKICFWKKRSRRNTQDDRERQELLNESVIGGSDETVKEAISTGIQLLLRTKVKSIVVLGKFGSGVYSTSCSISEGFRELKSNKWEILNCRYTEIPDTVNEKTIVFVYGWFGIWNDDLCSVDMAKTACQSLIRILNETTKVKFVIGMRSDLYIKYHGVLNVDDFQKHLFENEITLDSANTTEDAKFAYCYENMRKKCQKDECVFQNMTCEMIQTGKDNAVGMFLKLNLMERYHDQIHDYKGEWDISMAIRDHFISLENDETKRHVYAWIVYICFIGHFKQTGQFDTELVEKIGFQIDKSSFNENDKDLYVYFKMRNSYSENNVSPSDKQYVFWHPFIYICAFKFLFEKYPELVMKYCNVDAILQLVRPKEAQISYFEVTADEHCVNLFNERMHDLNLAERYMDNPLIKSRTCDTKRESQELQ